MKWFTGAAVVLLPLCAAAVALMAQAQMARTSARIEQLQSEARFSTGELESFAACVPDKAESLRRQQEIARQRGDARKSAAVVAALTSACERVGARVESVRPLAAAGGSGDGPAADPALLSELAVRADIATLGKLLDAIRDERVPLRVQSVDIQAEEHGPDRAFGAVRGVITVEAWRERKPAAPGGAREAAS